MAFSMSQKPIKTLQHEDILVYHTAEEVDLQANSTTFDSIPNELKSQRQWIYYIARQNGDRIDKIPFNPLSNPLKKASTTDPATWGTFLQCQNDVSLKALEQHGQQLYGDTYRGCGIGFVFSKNDPYFGIDLDHCFDSATDEPEAWASDIVDDFQTYTELSPSDTGLHLIGKGKLPDKGRRHDAIEVYDHARYFTMTGNRINDFSVVNCQPALDLLMDKSFPTTTETLKHTSSTNGHQIEDADLIERMFAARNGAAIRELWDGNVPDGKSASQADQALCNHLAFWTGCDSEQMDRIFRQSGLMRDKWNRESYRQPTIDEAISRCKDTYTPPDGASWALGLDEDERGKEYPLTDLGNAERFIAMHKDIVRFCYDFNKWIIWTGSHWQTDDSGTAVKLAKQTVRNMYRTAADIDDDNNRKALIKHAKSSESKRRIADMLSLAQSEHGIDIRPSDFDQQPWSLNCLDGTIDLQTGRLRPHNRDDLLTRCLPIHFDPHAKAPIWKRFLNRVTNGDVELQRYLQCLAGVSLAGKVRERIFIVLYGRGKNGKTTFLEALEMVFHSTTEGGYGTKLSARALMVQRYQSRATPEIAKLHGARFAYANEGQEGARLNEALIKEMTGGDTLTASFLYQNDFDFKPTFTLWFGTNHVPNITDTTDSIWDRVKLVPFTVRIPNDEIDLTLHEQLSSEAAGILNWCVEGCLDWLEHGLHDPKSVVEATKEYRSNMDQVAQFVEERCLLADFANVKASLLYSQYVEWSKQSGEHPVTQRDFGGRMTERGLQRQRKTTGYFYHGIDLNPTDETDGIEL